MATKFVAREPEVCHFFQLSGELRNYIYAYVLFEPAGLRCQIDPTGVTRIYSRWDKSQAKEVANDDDRTVTDPPNSPSVRSPAGCDDANQLKYVNRQLHQETRGLGIIYNELYFDTAPEFGTFVRMHASDKFKYLTKLHIDGRTCTDSDSLGWVEIIKFCSLHPSVRICLRNITTKRENEDCVLDIICRQMLFHKQENLMGTFFTDTMLQNSNSRMLKSLSLPSNFRVYPQQELFDEVTFRNMCGASPNLKFLLMLEGDGSIERWVAGMKGVYENGV